jgi:FAD/FMN-containing dehydrogenase
MRHTLRLLLGISSMTIGLAAPALAQPRTAAPRVFVGISGGSQTTTSEFADRFDFELYRETGTTRVTYPIDGGFLFDAGVGVRLWKGLGAGLSISRFARDGVAHTSTSLPHPFFLEQPRQIEDDAEGLRHEEVGVHIQAHYTVPITPRVQLTLMAGPTVLSVNQMMVNDVNYSEEYPYDTATFTGVDTTEVTASATGFNAGIDLRWLFTRNVGVGVLARVARATVELEPASGRTVSVDAGGAQFAAGIRFAF